MYVYTWKNTHMREIYTHANVDTRYSQIVNKFDKSLCIQQHNYCKHFGKLRINFCYFC